MIAPPIASCGSGTHWTHDAVMVTKDEDFRGHGGDREPKGPPVVWIRIGNTRSAEACRGGSNPLIDEIVEFHGRKRATPHRTPLRAVLTRSVR